MEYRQNLKYQVDLHGPQVTPETCTAFFLAAIGYEHAINLCDRASNNGQIHCSRLGPIDPAKAQRLAQDMSSRIFACHRDLHAILERHELTIQKRWAKKTKAQRQAILLEAWPNMAAGHHPEFTEFKAMWRKQLCGRMFETKHKDYFMWPYINQEDLSGPKMLLLLLNSRGRHAPCEFAAADHHAMRFGKVAHAFIPTKVERHTMVLGGATGPGDYGKLLAWDEHPDAKRWGACGIQYRPAEGFFILEAQDRLMPFLVSCCEQILHDIPREILFSEAFPVEPEPKLVTETESETIGFNSFVAIAAEAPYRVPPRLDFGRIEKLLAAKKSAAEDHLLSLREDPSYFAETLHNFAEHRTENIKDEDGDPHPLLDNPGKTRKNLFWGFSSIYMLTLAYLSLETFTRLHSLAQECRVLLEKHAASASLLEDLPEDFLHAMMKLHFYASQAVPFYLVTLNLDTKASPSFRKFFVYEPPDFILAPSELLKQRGVKMNQDERKVLGLLAILWGPESVTTPTPYLVDELERLIDVSPEAKRLVTPCMANDIEDIAILTNVIRQLRVFEPWARSVGAAMDNYRNHIYAKFELKLAPCIRDLPELDRYDKNCQRIGELADISGGRFAWPIDHRHTKENVEILRRSEANLDAFWDYIDKLTHPDLEKAEDCALHRFLLEPQFIQRFPEWDEEDDQDDQDERTETEVPATDSDPACESIYKPMSTLYFGTSPSDSEDLEKKLPKTKTKTKTRGRANSAAASSSEESDEDTDPPDPEPVFQVDARALEVFHTLFHVASVDSTPGELPWQDFLHAMVSVGFAPKKLYGSVWQFHPSTLEVNRSINFHEPHPRGKIRFCVARRFGRRLNRAYGWTAASFTLRQK
ncbi:hypothetical protein diail_2984 [Diaporthe ilicicola]|nr:hypothetical protein diail_2984 [Diaporthe ilicicola]